MYKSDTVLEKRTNIKRIKDVNAQFNFYGSLNRLKASKVLLVSNAVSFMKYFRSFFMYKKVASFF